MPTPHVNPPSVDDLLGGLDAPAWLVEPLRRAPCHDPFVVLEAVGSIARLWAPRGTSTPPAEALARLMADDDPAARAARWANSLPECVIDAVARLAEVQADVLRDELEGLEDGADLALDAVMWLERRDGLASVMWTLRGKRPGLDSAVELLDRSARTHATRWMFARSEAARSPRLASCAWMEPDAWWSDVVRL